jgi:hypothetical protein
MGLFTRLGAYWAADYAISRAAGKTHKESKKTANSVLAFGLFVFVFILLAGIGSLEGLENAPTPTERYTKDCKVVGDDVVCTDVLVNYHTN